MISVGECQELKDYLTNRPAIACSRPYSKSLLVYSINGKPFAYLETGKQLLNLSVKVDPRLAKLLKTKYEEVSDGYKLNPREWITIVVSGQLSLSELEALIDHSYQLVESNQEI